MNKFIRQNFACATFFLKRFYLGCFRGDLYKILQRYCKMMEVKEDCILLVDRALQR